MMSFVLQHHNRSFHSQCFFGNNQPMKHTNTELSYSITYPISYSISLMVIPISYAKLTVTVFASQAGGEPIIM